MKLEGEQEKEGEGDDGNPVNIRFENTPADITKEEFKVNQIKLESCPITTKYTGERNDLMNRL